MGLNLDTLQKALGTLVGNFFSNLWRPRKWGKGGWFYPFRMGSIWEDKQYLRDFNEIPEINAVINLKARAFSLGRLYVADQNGVELPNDPINLLLQSPNWFQDQKEFMRQTKINHEIFGNEYLYASMPVGRPEKTEQLFTLPPAQVDIKIKTKEPFYTIARADGPASVDYVIDVNGNRRTLPNGSIIHFNDNRVDGEYKDFNESALKGVSKMRALSAPRTNIRYSYESRGVILKRRGASGILSNDSKDIAGAPSIDPKEIERIQNEYAKYGGLEGQFDLIITDANLRWQQMAPSPDRLPLYDESNEAFRKFIDAYGAKVELFSSKTGTTFENQKQAWKSFYNDTVIPEANEWAAGLSKFLMPGSKNKIIIDYSFLPMFQEDMAARGMALNTLVSALSKALMDGAISLAQYQKELERFGIVAIK